MRLLLFPSVLPSCIEYKWDNHTSLEKPICVGRMWRQKDLGILPGGFWPRFCHFLLTKLGQGQLKILEKSHHASQDSVKRKCAKLWLPREATIVVLKICARVLKGRTENLFWRILKGHG